MIKTRNRLLADRVIKGLESRNMCGYYAANAEEALKIALELIPEAEFTTAAVQEALSRALVDELGLKPRVAYGPLRVALSGRRVSPPLFESMELLGRESVLARIDRLAASV